MTSLSISIDDQGPTVTVNPPAVFTSTTPGVPGTAVDNPVTGLLSSIELSLNGSGYLQGWQPVIRTARTSAATGPKAWLYGMSGVVADGVVYTATGRAADAAGNVGYSVPARFIVDNVPPRINNIWKSRAVALSATTVFVLTGTVTDGSGVWRMQARVHGPAGQVYTEPVVLVSGVYTYVPALAWTEGNYSLRLFASDIYGNTSDAGPYDYPPLLSQRIFVPMLMEK